MHIIYINIYILYIYKYILYIYTIDLYDFICIALFNTIRCCWAFQWAHLSMEDGE